LKGEAVIATEKKNTMTQKSPEFLKNIIKIRLDRFQYARVSSNVTGNLSNAVLREVVEV